MAWLPFKAHIDKGQPRLNELDGVYSVLCDEGDKGRWLGYNDSQLPAGSQWRISGEMRTNGPQAKVILIWWKESNPKEVHSAELVATQAGGVGFEPFSYETTVPAGVRAPRLDLRGWSGYGQYYFKDIDIQPVKPDPDPDPDPDPEGPYMVMRDLPIPGTDVVWKITANEESVTARRGNWFDYVQQIAAEDEEE